MLSPDYRALFEYAPGLFLVVLPDEPVFTIVAASDAYLRAVKKSREDIVGRSLFEAFPERPQPAHAATLQNLRGSFGRVMASGQPDKMPVQRYDLPLDSEGGGFEERYWNILNAPVFGGDGSLQFLINSVEDVTEFVRLKRTEERVQQQWQTFDTALSHTPDFAYTFDLDGRFTYVNRALLSLWQRSLEDSLGKNFFDLDYPPELAGRLQRQERSKTEQLIEQDRRRWRELLLQTPAAIAVLRGPEHRFEWVNANYARMVGRPAEALVGKTVAESLPEMTDQIYLNLLNGVFRTGEPSAGHESLVHLDRGDGVLRKVYVNFVYLATKDTTGAIDGIFAHINDVTDMVLARKQIEESEAQFRTLAESIPHLTWMADDTGHIFWYNRRWFDYTGTTFEDMEGWGWQKVHDPAVLPSVVAQWTGAIASGEPFAMVFPLKGADGGYRSFLTRVEPVRDSQGRVVRWFGTNTDITDQRKTEEELRRLNSGLEEFAYVASHDLQEPLRMVNTYTQLLLRRLGPQTSTELQDYAGYIRTGVGRMETLIRDLLTYSRETHSTIEAPDGRADLGEAFRMALALVDTRIRDDDAVVTVDPLPVVRGETGQLAHVFQNLLSNALKYRKPGEQPRIHVEAERKDAEWVVTMRDNGIGFAQRYAERIFGLFKRLHREEEYAGTGLGLAICKRIVERHGGRMWAESEEGAGARFFFTVPAVDS